MKALIVEPSRSSRLFLSMTLGNRGIEVDCAKDEDTAKVFLGHGSYDVICIAKTLESGDCRNFCSMLRANAATQATPIVMLSATDDIDSVEYLTHGITEIVGRNDSASLIRCMELYRTRSKQKSADAGNILYIEDSQSLAISVSKLLKDHGYQVTHFASGEEALSHFRYNDFDLILTDVVLEGSIGGTALVRHIRDTERADQFPIPILAMSAFNDASRTLALFQAGANDYVSKPIIDDELLARINNQMLTQRLFRELQEQQAELEQVAMTDQLTGLYNRHYLMETAGKKISFANRHGNKLSMIVFDLDHFKEINDKHGHAIGDLVLRKVGELMRKQTRNEDIVARFGGEEFVIMLDHCDLKFAAREAERIRETLNNTNIDVVKGGLQVSGSFGVAEYAESDVDFNGLFVRADKAAYLAKMNGRDGVIIAD